MPEKERERLRKLQSKKVMPLIGSLLDTWDDIPNDVRDAPELEYLRLCLEKIDDTMEGRRWTEKNE